jgi:hypothetical protein
MKNLYNYYPEFNDNDELLWMVYEQTSDQIVAQFFFEEDAEELCKFLEKGGGFAGFTPNFILQRVPVQDINQNFQAEFS